VAEALVADDHAPVGLGIHQFPEKRVAFDIADDLRPLRLGHLDGLGHLDPPDENGPLGDLGANGVVEVEIHIGHE